MFNLFETGEAECKEEYEGVLGWIKQKLMSTFKRISGFATGFIVMNLVTIVMRL